MLKVLLVEDENLIRRGLAFQMNWTDVGCVLVGEAASGTRPAIPLVCLAA